MSKREYAKGFGIMKADERAAASAKGCDDGLGIMVADDHALVSAKGCAKGHDDDADERAESMKQRTFRESGLT